VDFECNHQNDETQLWPGGPVNGRKKKTEHNFADGYQKLRDDAKVSELCSDDGVNQSPHSNFPTYPVNLESQIDIEDS
jgi:hypothetical protein